MTASDATATIKKGNSEPSFDKTAQRILNLFFVLNSLPRTADDRADRLGF